MRPIAARRPTAARRLAGLRAVAALVLPALLVTGFVAAPALFARNEVPPPGAAAARPGEPNAAPPGPQETGDEAAAGAAPRSAPAGSLVVLNKSGNDSHFIDVATGTTWLTLPTRAGPHEVAITPDGRTAVVANYGASTGGNTLSVYDIPSRRVAKVIDLGRHTRPHGIVPMKDGRRVLVTTEGSQSLLVVDIEDGDVELAVNTDAAVSHMVVATPDERLAFVANIGSGSVSVIDLEEEVLHSTIETGSGAEGIDVTPDGREVWVTNREANTVSIIDVGVLDVRGELSCGRFPIRVAITPDGERALVTCALSSEVAVIDTGTREEVGRITLDLEMVDDAGERLFGSLGAGSPLPIGVLVAPDGSRAFVAAANADVVVVIDLETLEVVDGLPTGREPDGLGWTPLSGA